MYCLWEKIYNKIFSEKAQKTSYRYFAAWSELYVMKEQYRYRNTKSIKKSVMSDAQPIVPSKSLIKDGDVIFVLFAENRFFLNRVKHRVIKKYIKSIASSLFFYSILRELISRVFSCNLKIFWDIISHNCPGTLWEIMSQKIF